MRLFQPHPLWMGPLRLYFFYATRGLQYLIFYSNNEFDVQSFDMVRFSIASADPTEHLAFTN
jgi:hypothetical protein